MKILALIGSYRKNGNTSQVVNLVCEALQAEAARAGAALEIETLYLGHLDIGFCRGCRACFDRGEDKCPVKDDLLAVKAKMKAADGWLVATPVYVSDVSGITKNWIDRLAHVCHRPEFAGKSAYLLATTGSTPAGHTLDTLAVALSTWGVHIVGKTGLKAGALMRGSEARTLCQAQAQAIASKLFQAIHQRKFARPSFRALITFKVQQRVWQRAPLAETIDSVYWREQGWTDPSCDFYIPHEASRLKVFLARLAGSLIAPFVS